MVSLDLRPLMITLQMIKIKFHIITSKDMHISQRCNPRRSASEHLLCFSSLSTNESQTSQRRRLCVFTLLF